MAKSSKKSVKSAPAVDEKPVEFLITNGVIEKVESTDAVEPQQAESVPTETSQPEAKKIDLDQPHVRSAIEQGRALISDGKSKADAARAIYALLENEPKELIVAAFVAGATLTEKGAMTYWYNCRRKAAKSNP